MDDHVDAAAGARPDGRASIKRQDDKMPWDLYISYECYCLFFYVIFIMHPIVAAILVIYKDRLPKFSE